jgi:hypothetical protein
MASPEPQEEQHGPDSEPDRKHEPTERSDRRARWNRAAARWWQPVRAGLVLLGIVAEARGDDALASGAKAIALFGDAVLRTGKNS